MAKKKVNTAVGSLIPANEVSKFKSAGGALVGKAIDLEIHSADTETMAYGVLKQIATKKKEVEARRKEITQPLNKSLKATNALFKEIAAPLVDADSILREKILAFQRVQQEKAAKEQERREAIQASHEERGHETHELAEVAPDVGESTVTKRWTYEVVDESKIPRKYLVPHPVAIRQAITDGERDIPGLKIYQKEGLRV